VTGAVLHRERRYARMLQAARAGWGQYDTSRGFCGENAPCGARNHWKGAGSQAFLPLAGKATDVSYFSRRREKCSGADPGPGSGKVNAGV
jgi:hypothetical protein